MLLRSGIVVALLMLTPINASAHGPQSGPCIRSGWGDKGWSEKAHRAEMKILHCAIRHWAVSGGYDKAHGIAHRESGSLMWRRAINLYSGACGVFQHLQSYWEGRARTFLNPRWFGRHRWTNSNVVGCTNARANEMVAIRMANTSGWGPWGG